MAAIQQFRTIDTIVSYAPETYAEKECEVREEIAEKIGRWNYYDESGKIRERIN